MSITRSSSLSAFTQEESHSWLLSSHLFLRGRVEESDQQAGAERGSRSSSKFLSNSQNCYGWGRECLFYIPRGHFVTKLTVIYFSNVSTSESKVLQCARQKQIFTFPFARKKINFAWGKATFLLLLFHFGSDSREKKKKKYHSSHSILYLLVKKAFLNLAVVEESCYSASSYFQHLSRGIPEEFCFLCLPISHPQAHSTKANPSLVKMQLLASYRGKKQKDAQKGRSPSLAPYLQVQRPGGKKSMLATDHHPPHPNIKAPLKERAHLTHV